MVETSVAETSVAEIMGNFLVALQFYMEMFDNGSGLSFVCLNRLSLTCTSNNVSSC